MHKSEIKKFAVWARRTLIQQISQRAALFGLLPDQLIPAESQSFDKLVIQGQTYGTEEARGYTSLIKRLQHFKSLHNDQHKSAFNALIDEAAYTWFNRLTALRFLASVLGPKAKESPEDTLRRYFTTQFMKEDHHQIYKRRPIYWLFTSGKKRAFNAYVYLHRYSPDTLGLLRTEYLHPLQLKLEAELNRLQGDPANAKRIKALQDQLVEIQAYDEKLKHKAEQRISINLDDGVAYNYTLFEGLVYEGADLKAKSQWKRDLLANKS